MTAKKFLQQIPILDRKIKLDFRRLDELRELSMKVSSSNYEQNRNPNMAQEAPFAKAIEKIDEMERSIEEEIGACMDFKKTALGMIHSVPDFDQREVLEMRYIGKMSWEDIAAERRFTTRWVYKIHGQALKAFEEIWSESLENCSVQFTCV